MLMKCAFLDRDGALIFEPNDTFQIDSIEKLKILDGVIEALKKLVTAGYKLVMVTNQNGVGTLLFPQENFDKPQQRMLDIFKENGIEFERIFVCPHLPEDGCDCRKPKMGLVKDFIPEVDLANSFMCGDRDTDVEFARNIGVKAYKIDSNSDQLLATVNQILS